MAVDGIGPARHGTEWQGLGLGVNGPFSSTWERAMKVEFELVGKTAMLMHADDVDAADALEAWRKNPVNKNMSKPGDDRTPPWTWQAYLYTDGEFVAMPADCIMVCLRNAGARIPMKGKKTYKEVTQSGMVVTQEFCDLLVNDEKIPIEKMSWQHSADGILNGSYKEHCKLAEKHGFRLFAKRARIGQAKHIRVRPRFDRWKIRGTLSVFAPELGFDVLKQIFEIAGQVGLCDWRPGCKTPGSYGMFEATLKK
jgi:hypothetical protein